MRNRLSTAVLIACFVAASPAVAPAQDLVRVSLVHALPQLTPSFAIASSLPSYLGYWKEEGLDVEVNTTPGTAAAMQLVISKQATVGYGNPHSAIVARQRGANVSFYYTSLRGDIFGIGLPDGSGLKELGDLKGKVVGVSSFASGGNSYARALLEAHGLEPGKDVTITEIGVGGRAAAALKGNQVQALSLWDEAYARMDQLGIKLTRVIKDPRASNFIAGSLVVNDDDIVKQRKVLIGIARGIAKAQLFQETNPEAAVRIHWKVYPQTAPRAGITDETVKAEAAISAVRSEIQSRNVFGTGRYGDLPKEKMESFQDYLLSSKQIERKLNASEYFTNDLIDEINKFDSNAIVQQAKTFVLK